MKSLKYDIRFTIIRQTDDQNLYYMPDKYCNSITVKNIDGTNTDTCTVNNNVTLQPGDNANKIPGESFSFGGNYAELYAGTARIQLTFSGAAGIALVIEKYYTNYEEICQ